MAADLKDFLKAVTLIKGTPPAVMPAADFPDWTTGVYEVTGTIPAGADFPDWTDAVGVVGTVNYSTFSSAGAATGTSVSVAAPSGTKDGDVLWAVYACSVAVNTLTLPSGWVAQNSQTGATRPFATVLAVGAVSGTVPASFTFSCSASCAQRVTMGNYPSATTTNTAYNFGTSGTATTADAGGLAGAQFLVAVFVGAGGATFTTPTTPAGILRENDATADMSVAWFDLTWTTSADPGTQSSTMTPAGSWASYQVVI